MIVLPSTNCPFPARSSCNLACYARFSARYFFLSAVKTHSLGNSYRTFGLWCLKSNGTSSNVSFASLASAIRCWMVSPRKRLFCVCVSNCSVDSLMMSEDGL